MPSAKIVPHLWFDQEAKAAARFYASCFPDSRVTHVTVLPDTPGRDAEVVSFELAGQPFMAISAGPLFRFNPSISFILNFDPSRDAKAEKNLDALWRKLRLGGKERMPLGAYPFSKRYGWLEDKYGLSWQFILTDPRREPRPFITPCLMFVGKNAGEAEEATEFYLSVFERSRRGSLIRYPKGMEPDKEETIMFTDFRLDGVWLAAMDSARPHDFRFNEAVSLMVRCRDQKEIDQYWERLSAVKEAEQCGWLKDRYGVSWQIVPAAMGEMMQKGSREQVAAVTRAFLPMKKLDLPVLEAAYEGASKPPRPSGPEHRVGAYLAGLDPKNRAALQRVRRAVLAAAPDAKETWSYGVPAYKVGGKGVAGFKAFKRHLSFFPMSGTIVDRFRTELRSYRTSKGTIQFTPENPLPSALVKRLVGARLEEIRGAGLRAGRRRASVPPPRA